MISKKLKVYSGIPDGRYYILIAAPSRNQAHKIYTTAGWGCRCSIKCFADYVGETSHETLCKIALAHPGVLLRTKKNWSFAKEESDWEVVLPREQK